MGWGSSTRRGGGRKVRALLRKFVFLGFRGREPGMSWEFRRDVPDPWGCSKGLCKKSSCSFFSQGALKGTNLRGQIEPRHRFSLIFADSRRFPENEAFGKRRFRRKPLIFKGNHRKPQEPAANRRLSLRFVPLSAALFSFPIKIIFELFVRSFRAS